jgi:glycosyltransferase involved in cell wall biosynthesis
MRSELDLPAALSMAGALRRFGADIVHFHTARAHTLGLAAASIARTPVKVLSRRVDFPVGQNVFSRIKYRASVDAVVAITRAVKDVLVDGGVSADSVTVIHSGIDLEKFREPADGSYVKRELGIPHSAPLVGAVGALAPHKAQSYFLRAAKNLAEQKPEVRYIIVGEGELEAELKSLSNSLGVEGVVTFAGFRRDIVAVLAALDVFVLSSVAEGLCTSILDAMASGVPVVATAVGGVPEVVEDGVSGVLVPPADPEAMAGAVGRVLEDDALKERLVNGGRRRATEFSLSNTVEKTERLYMNLIKRKRGGLN